jgi:glyoxylase-like metal-dependent hydrolase (beta-lactamase superfamily II)
MPDHDHTPALGLDQDPYRLGASGMPYTTQADYLPLPPEAITTVVGRDRLKKGYVTEEIGDGVYYVTNGSYDAMFVVTGNGVVIIDTPPVVGENMRRAVAEVTNEPVTHFIYSHWHKDHTGASGIWGPDVTYVGHALTREKLVRWPGPSPAPTETFTTNSTLDVNGVKLEMSYMGQNHCEGNIFIYAPKQKVLAAIDISSPGWSTFRACDASESTRGWVDAHDEILKYDFTAHVAGHANRWGTRDDAIVSREYVQDMVAISKEGLEQCGYLEILERIGSSNGWVLWDNYLNEITNWATKQILTKTTSNGRTWAQRLAGADVMTKYHIYCLIQGLRLEWGVHSKMETEVFIPKTTQNGLAATHA